jgi:hypothetical protein
MTVVETDRFLKDTKTIMSDSERAELVLFLGANPERETLSPIRAACERCVGRAPEWGNAEAHA